MAPRRSRHSRLRLEDYLAAVGLFLFAVGGLLGVGGQPLSSRQVGALRLGHGQQWKTWLDGRPFAGEVSGLVLRPRDQVVLEVGPPFVPPPRYDWNSESARRETSRVS